MSRPFVSLGSCCVLTFLGLGLFNQAFAQFSDSPYPAQATPVEPVGDPANPMAVPRPRPDGKFRVQLHDGSMVFGKLEDAKPLSLTASVGRVTVPIAKLASVEFHKDKPDSTTVILRNGDRLTGELTSQTFELQAAWGPIELEMNLVKSVLAKDLCGNLTRTRRVVTTRDAFGNVHSYTIEESTLAPNGSAYITPGQMVYPSTSQPAVYQAPAQASPAPSYAPSYPTTPPAISPAPVPSTP